MFNNSDSI